jgi:hypothetical protein
VFSERACPDKGISIFASAIHFLGVVVVVVLEFNLRMPSLLGKHLPLDSSPGSVIFHVGSVFAQGNLEHNPSTYANHRASVTVVYSCVDTWLIS